MKFDKLFITGRIRPTTIPRNHIEEYFSDKTRITFCSSFRRLMQKAQVFSLEANSSVRNRLTHTLEVADVGRNIAFGIADKLIQNKLLSADKRIPFYTIVECACLVHDIGNPPFGHFGEEAIKHWFEKNGDILLNGQDLDESSKRVLLADFMKFDGNPQSLRTVAKLHSEQDEFGLNLTIPTLLSTLKSTVSSIEEVGRFAKKPGYFITETELVGKLWKETKWIPGNRFPLVYIMEAADDICYCLSDIADAIEKRIIRAEQFLEYFAPIVKGIPKMKLRQKRISYFGRNVSVPWAKQLINQAVEKTDMRTGLGMYRDRRLAMSIRRRYGVRLGLS